MIKPVTMYSVVCDRCGKTFEADGIVAWTDECSAREQALESEWREMGKKHYCPDCFNTITALMGYSLKLKGGEE